ncbi:MAG TPA: hypothetical protein VFZ25_11860 [Chloroflexota bacterium]|nr:hypothetical protein [Chloroflexota bacterium]
MTHLEQLAAKARNFHDLHAGPEILVMANAWDAATYATSVFREIMTALDEIATDIRAAIPGATSLP